MMNGPLLYLATHTVINRVRVWIRRLREPRYAAGLAAAVCYFYYFFFRRPRRGRISQTVDGASWLVSQREMLEPVLGAGLLVLAVLAWVFVSRSRPALAFSQAEVQFLFTAPVARRHVVHYKLLRAQLSAVVTSLLFTVLSRPRLSTAWMVFLGMFAAMATANLYLIGAWLSRESLRRHGRSGLVRSGLPAVALGAAAVLLVGSVVHGWPALTAAANARPGDLAVAIGTLGRSWPVRVALFPFTALIGPLFADGPAQAIRALLMALGVGGLTYAWALRSDVAFEEASAEQAERRARQPRDRAMPRSRRSTRVPFALAPQGRPEAAVIWKNLIAVGRYGSLRTLVGMLGAVVALGVVVSARAGGVSAALGRFSAIAAAVTVFFGPQMVRNDLRQDLAHLAVLKSWPVRGAALLRGEVLGSTLFLSAIAALFLVAAAPLSAGLAARWRLGPWDRGSYTIAALLLASGLVLTQVVIHNAMALFFPAWVQATGTRARGLDTMGQNLLMTAGLVLALGVTLAPAALAGTIAALAFRAAIGVVPVVGVAAVAAIVIAFQNALAIEMLGGQLDRMDVSAVDPG
jgi:hypothetical protein